MEPFEITWQAPEFEYREKGVAWYWISIVVAVILLGLSVWQKNFLLGVFIVLAEIMVLVWANEEPRFLDFKLNEKGLTIGPNKFYAYADLESFAVDENASGEWAELIFNFHKRLRTSVKARFPREDAEDLRETLKQILKEVEHNLSLLDAVEKFIRF